MKLCSRLANVTSGRLSDEVKSRCSLLGTAAGVLTPAVGQISIYVHRFENLHFYELQTFKCRIKFLKFQEKLKIKFAQ